MIEMIVSMWREDWIGRSLVILAVLFILLIPLAIVGAVQAERQWEAFRVAHDCRIVGQMSGSSSVGFGLSSDGKPVTTYHSTPGKTGWRCNDGVTYWR
jgi:hypothetical protein